jgi:hypothetical protein
MSVQHESATTQALRVGPDGARRSSVNAKI